MVGITRSKVILVFSGFFWFLHFLLLQEFWNIGFIGFIGFFGFLEVFLIFAFFTFTRVLEYWFYWFFWFSRGFFDFCIFYICKTSIILFFWGPITHIFIYVYMIPPLPMRKVDFWGGGTIYIYTYTIYTCIRTYMSSISFLAMLPPSTSIEINIVHHFGPKKSSVHQITTLQPLPKMFRPPLMQQIKSLGEILSKIE